MFYLSNIKLTIDDYMDQVMNFILSKPSIYDSAIRMSLCAECAQIIDYYNLKENSRNPQKKNYYRKLKMCYDLIFKKDGKSA